MVPSSPTVTLSSSHSTIKQVTKPALCGDIPADLVEKMETDSLKTAGERLDQGRLAVPTTEESRPASGVSHLSAASQHAAETELVTFRKAVETSGEVIFLTDPGGFFSYVNPEFTRLYGHEFDEVVGRTTPRILKSGLMTTGDYERFWNTLLNKQIIKGEFINRCKDGSLVTVEGSANPILDEQGEIVGFLAIQRDITRRVQVEEKIRQQNRELAALYAIATTVSHSLNLNQILNDALDEVLQLDMFGGVAKGMLFRLNERKDRLELIAQRGAPSDHPCLRQAPLVGECLCGLAAQNNETIISEDCWEDEQHSRQWPEMPGHKDICLPINVRSELLGIMNLRLPDTHEIGVHDVDLLTSIADQIGVALENARLFEEVSQQHERLRAFSSRLAEAEETERRRLARELHDQVGRKLTALGINLNILRTEAPAGASDALTSRLVESQELVQQTTRLLRGVMSDLHPPTLDDLGLVDTLHWYGEQFASRTGLSVVVESDKPVRPLPTPIANALFRIAQESLSNVAKHARATEVTITVDTENGTVRLIVADNGIGFDQERGAIPGDDHGWGLLIMAERAEAVGGRCWVESRPAKEGTQVIVEVPR